MSTTMYDMIDAIGPLLVLRDHIRAGTNLRPTAVMLPLSLFPDVTAVYGLPVIRGDREALIYEPGRNP